MKAVLAGLRELWGLFVEDASFTIGILICIGFAAFGLPRVVGPQWRGPIFFLSLALVLLENCRRSAR